MRGRVSTTTTAFTALLFLCACATHALQPVPPPNQRTMTTVTRLPGIDPAIAQVLGSDIAKPRRDKWPLPHLLTLLPSSHFVDFLPLPVITSASNRNQHHLRAHHFRDYDSRHFPRSPGIHFDAKELAEHRAIVQKRERW